MRRFSAAVLLVALTACGGSTGSKAPPPTTTRGAPTTATTTTASMLTTVTVPSTTAGPFAPKSLADLTALGSTAPDQAKDTDRRTVGLGSCPQLSVQVVFPAGLSDRDLTAALSRVFVNEHISTRCGGTVFAFKDKSEFNDAWTLGRLLVSGPDRVSPGGSKGNVEVDSGTAVSPHVIAKFDY